jgi:hypothetical protein
VRCREYPVTGLPGFVQHLCDVLRDRLNGTALEMAMIKAIMKKSKATVEDYIASIATGNG